MATREDVAKLEASLWKWAVGIILTIFLSLAGTLIALFHLFGS